MTLAEKIVRSADDRLRILAPQSQPDRPAPIESISANDPIHKALLDQAQCVRGAEYLRDGAISPADLDSRGRYCQPEDRDSWHVLRIGETGKVEGCARYRAHPRLRSFRQLSACESAIAGDDYWGGVVRRALRYELSENQRTGRDFFEVGGWAISRLARFSEAALTVAIGTYALGRLLGGGRGITTATTRNHSARMLRRLGGRSLACGKMPLPAYFDPAYGCVMEILAFDTAKSNPHYAPLIDAFVRMLAVAPVWSAGQNMPAIPHEALNERLAA